MHKLLYEVDGKFQEHSFSALFSQSTVAGVSRIVAGQPAGGLAAFESLTVHTLKAPFLLLYILHTPRGEARPGRYQSQEIGNEDLSAFLSRFSAFLCSDSRFDLWVHSPSERGTVVLDRHNQLFAYGPIDRFAQSLRAIGYDEGVSAVDFAHAHQYRPEFDGDAIEILKALDWRYSELQPEDEQ